ncbi:hypothetical protein [Dactylosporangium salmoneum]|uniref:Uncharacterized protein n=1 Tax=Dactylosporangium salmoneum TaxID=53361 RepID=A0ABN3G7F1_9ACTN
MKLLRLVPAVLLAASGCAAAGSAADSAGSAASYAPGDLVVRVLTGGGFAPVSAAVTQLPEISVYGDGRVVTIGPVPGLYPGPALPNIQVRRISAADVRRLAQRGLAAGVGRGEDMGVPTNVADAPTTHITVRTASGAATTDVPAMGIDSAGDGMTADQRAARERMRQYVEDLRDLPKTLGRNSVGEAVPYEPARIAAVATPWQPSADGLPSDPPAVEWPSASALPGDPVPDRTGVNCLAVEASPVLSAANSANARTPWLSGGTRWAVEFRPLLPDESGCADLGR